MHPIVHQHESSMPPLLINASNIDDTIEQTPMNQPTLSERQLWMLAFKRVLPIYSATHVALLVVTAAFATLFLHPDFAHQGSLLAELWQNWNRWDVGHYTEIATNGYTKNTQTAFFPLYPLLMRGVMFLIPDALIAGLIIANLAGLLMLVVLYRLVHQDFDAERAERTVLYLSLFPTAFFLVTAYNESIFLCLALLCFYCVRRGNWWLAGLFGLLASLTRSAGVFLLIPFAYEFLRQHEWRLKQMIRPGILAALLIPAGVGIFALYCFYQFGDPLAFSHAQKEWQRAFAFPWSGIARSIKAILISSGPLSFQAQHNYIDLGANLFCAVLLLLAAVGPWRFPRSHWSYLLYAGTLWLFFNLVPHGGVGFYPLLSIARFSLELFPAFILLATLGKSRTVHLHYVLIASALLFLLATRFLTGHWVL